MSPSDARNLENGGKMVARGVFGNTLELWGASSGDLGDGLVGFFCPVFVFSMFCCEKCGFVILLALCSGIAAFACPGDQVGARWAQKTLLLLLLLADG